MKVAVAGLWHLGCVTAACLAKSGHEVLGFDSNTEVINKLQQGNAPIFEPGLDNLITETFKSNHLRFTSQSKDLFEAEIVWVNYDTPIDENDVADTAFVINEVKNILPDLAENTLILISSQLPVGSTRQLQNDCAKQYPNKKITFGYIPENLRLGKAIQVFSQPDRFVVGLQTEEDKIKVQTLLSPLTENIVWMSIESAEMTKHALNAFLATSVVFINELATLCEQVGANAFEVEKGLKSEERIGAKSYLKPGSAIAGGTLLRDVNYLNQFSELHHTRTPLLAALLESNQYHKEWLKRKVSAVLDNLNNKTIAVLGLTYKPNTNTLRRSSAVETSEWLHQQGAIVQAYDPMVNSLPANLTDAIQLKASIAETLENADALIIATEWPQFREANIEQFIASMNRPFVFDPSSFLITALGQNKKINYYTIGRAA